MNRQPPIYTHVVFQKFFQKLAIWNSINDTNRSLLFQVSYKYGLTQHLLSINFTHKTVELENCEFWAWMKKTMPCRRQGEKGRHVEEESKILPHFPKTPRQRCWIFYSLQSQFFWALSDFPGSSFNRFPYVSQSSLQPNLCSKDSPPLQSALCPRSKAWTNLLCGLSGEHRVWNHTEQACNSRFSSYQLDCFE